ncbi:MAG: glycosyltransferase family 4 protein [Candidatus Heimdallarchaeota archaeon]
MKILIILHKAKKKGGLVLQILKLAELFKLKGHQVEIVSFDSISNSRNIIERSICVKRVLKEKINNFNPSLILTSDPYITTLPILLTRKKHIPVVSRAGAVYHAFYAARVAESVSPNNVYNSIYYTLNKLLKFVSRLTYGKLDLIIFNSHFLKKIYQKSAPHSLVIHNGVEFTKQQKVTSNKPIKLVYVGRVEPRKTLELVIESLVILKSKKIKYNLTIIGGSNVYPDYWKKISKSITKNQLEDSIEILGEIKNTEIPKILQQQDLLLFTSDERNFPITEGLPNVLLEGMANGLAIITTSVAGVPEIVTKDNGFIVESNPNEIAEKIEYLSKNEKILLQIKKNNREYIQKNHLLENIAIKYLKAFEYTLRNKKK